MLTALLAALASSPAEAQSPEVDFGGLIQSDLRFRVLMDKDDPGPYYAPVEPLPQIIRNQNLFKTKITAKSGNFRGVADMDFVMTGYPLPVDDLQGLTLRQNLEPMRIETHAMYFEGRDLLTKNLDLRVGQQLVQFGVGDQFNPTNTFNPNDVEDVLLFGDQMANIMGRLDYTIKSWTLTGVLIPIFKPSLIPRSAPIGLSMVDRLPFVEEDLRWRVHAEREAGVGFGYPVMVDSVQPKYPEPTLKNMQWGLVAGGLIGQQDLSLSYYKGFADIPVPVATHTSQVTEEICNNRGNECVDGLLVNETQVAYPRIQVAGLNLAGEIPVLLFGYRLEAALVFPEEKRVTLTNDELVFLGGFYTQPEGEYDYGLKGGQKPIILEKRPYPKWVAGLDYTIGSHLYVNAQWVHGMLDELGAGDNLLQEGYTVRDGGVDTDEAETAACAFNQDGEACAWEILRARQSDLAVIGADYNFASNSGRLRLFTILDLTGIQEEHYNVNKETRVRTKHSAFSKEGFSAVIYPELAYNFGNGLELMTGTLFNLGKDYTKFGSPEAGGSFYYTRARYAF